MAVRRSRCVAAMTRTSTWIGCAPPTRSNLPLLEDPQECDLRVGRNVADFIQEDGASIRQFKAPRAPLHRSGEGALLMTEQFRGDQSRRQCRAVHTDEGAAGSMRIACGRRVRSIPCPCPSRRKSTLCSLWEPPCQPAKERHAVTSRNQQFLQTWRRCPLRPAAPGFPDGVAP